METEYDGERGYRLTEKGRAEAREHLTRQYNLLLRYQGIGGQGMTAYDAAHYLNEHYADHYPLNSEAVIMGGADGPIVCGKCMDSWPCKEFRFLAAVAGVIELAIRPRATGR